jgi:hypothetical protein
MTIENRALGKGIAIPGNNGVYKLAVINEIEGDMVKLGVGYL